MNHLAESQASPSIAGTLSRRFTLIAAATLGTLLVSRAPEIVLREAIGLSTPWLQPGVIAIAAFLWLGTRLISPIASLSSYFAVMTVIATIVVAVPILFESAVWATLVEPSAGALPDFITHGK
jgi:hypothetical protein